MSVFAEWYGVARRLCTPLILAVGMAACGGGTSQVERFVPARLIVFGDEDSLIVNDGANNGKKYTVNGLDATPLRDCLLLPIWVQALAAHYNRVFDECNKTAITPLAFMRARAAATVEHPTLGMAAQLAAQAAGGGAVKAGDLVVVMLGANDLYALADRLKAGTITAAEASSEARRLARVLAGHINNVLDTGARAIVSTVPDVGLSPYALALNEAGSSAASTRLSALVLDFNGTLRTSIDSTRFDGRNYGLVLADDVSQSMARNPTVFSLTNTISGVCVTALPNCTSAAADLVVTAGATTNVAAYLWADSRHVSPAVHARIGEQATARASGNPF